MIPTTYPSKLDGLSNQTTMQVSFLSSVTGLKPWTDYIPVKYVLDSSVENSYNTNGYVNVADVGATTALQAWKDYVPVYVDSTATKANSTDVGGYVPIGHSKSSIGSALDLVFTNVSALPGTITFTRASSATYFNSAGVLSTASNNVPRFDYDPATKQSLGLLIEESRTNLLTDSEVWVGGVNCTILSDSTTSPNGAITADGVSATAAGSIFYSGKIFLSFVAGTTYTFSIYVKRGTTDRVQLSSNSASVFGIGAIFDLTSATVVAGSGEIRPCGNGWFRCSVTGSGTVSGPQTVYAIPVTPGDTTHYIATYNGEVGIYQWGAQLEAGSFPTSYIPTTAAAATRAADTAVMTGTNFSSWFNQNEGSFFAEASGRVGMSGSAIILTASSNSVASLNTTPQIDFLPTPSLRGVYTNTAGSILAQNITSIASTGVSYKVATSVNTSGTSQVINGGSVVTATISSLPTPTMMAIGSAETIQFLNGYIKRITYYPTRLSNAQLQAMTA